MSIARSNLKEAEANFWSDEQKSYQAWVDVAVEGLQGWIACFNKAKLSGIIRGVGVIDNGDVQHNEKLLSEAYKMGKAI